MDLDETEKFVDDLRFTFDRLSNLNIPTIAVIEGLTLGGGLELALSCDLRISGKNGKFGLPETKLGIFPA